MEKRKLVRLRIEHVWGLVVLCGIFLFVNTHPIRPNDFWFHLAYGRLLSQSGQIPETDLFSFTREGQPYTSAYNYWLAQWLMYQLFVHGGIKWTILTFSLLVTLAYGLILGLCLRLTGDWRLAAAGALFAAAAGVTNWNVRPQLLVYPLAALSIVGIEAVKSGRRPLLWGAVLFAAMAVWVNCHATFFIPLVLCGFWLIESIAQAVFYRRSGALLSAFAVFVVLLACILANPRGYKVFAYLYQIPIASSAQEYFYEWQSASFHTLEGVLFFLLCSVLLLGGLATRYRPTLAQALSFAFFAILAVKYVRAVVWFGLTQASLFALILQAAKDRYAFWRNRATMQPGERPVLNVLLATLIIALSLLSLPWLREYWPLSAEKQDIYAGETPIGATDYLLEHHPSARVFSDIGFSSYLIWACAPRCRVFIDPRFDLYPLSLWEDYVRMSIAMGDWQERLRDYHVDVLMLSPKTQGRLIRAVRQSVGWEQAYEDAVAVVFVRQE